MLIFFLLLLLLLLYLIFLLLHLPLLCLTCFHFRLFNLHYNHYFSSSDPNFASNALSPFLNRFINSPLPVYPYTHLHLPIRTYLPATSIDLHSIPTPDISSRCSTKMLRP